jgi:hypothetical protein
MTTRKISHARGRGSLNHNNRNHIYKNVDAGRTHLNIHYARESLSEAYQKCFGEAALNYNTKQKRADRKIENYYNHLFGNANRDTVATSSNKEKSFYEIVVGIGDMKNTASGSAEGEIAAKILDEYARGFSERNPNFYVFNSVLHMDEKTPHLHIDYVPIADGYKNGLAVRNSQSIALERMGFGRNKNSISEWRIQERQILRELCQQYGLEIAEETEGRGKTHTPDEYKKIRDEVKEELRADPDIADEIKDEAKDELRDDFIAEHKQALIVEAEEQAAAEVGQLKRKLAEETRPRIEGNIAGEQRVNRLIDGMREETRGWGSNKKPYTIIEVPNMTNEQALTVLKAAQTSAQNMAATRKYKEERDTAVAEKDTAISKRDAAITAKELAEKQKRTALATAKTAKEEAASEKADADATMKRATALYHQQQNINGLYQQAASDRDYYKDKAVQAAERATALTGQVTNLKEGLRNAYTSTGAIAKANAALLYAPNLKIANLTPEQERVLKAASSYAAAHARKMGFEDIAQDVDKHYEITTGMQKHIDELTPKPQVRNRSYGPSR